MKPEVKEETSKYVVSLFKVLECLLHSTPVSYTD